MAGGGGFLRREVVPFTAMVMVECSAVGSAIFFKAAVSEGLSYQVFQSYSSAISSLISLPLAYFCHRNQALPPFTIGVFFRFFLLGVIGFLMQLCAFKGIELSNPTMSSALSNLNPAATFFLAILTRKEKLKLRSLSSQAKIIGTVVCIAGALVVVFYKGPPVITMDHQSQPRSLNLWTTFCTVSSQQANWIVGGGLLTVAYILLSVFYILQAKFVEEYPAVFRFVFWYNLSCLMVSLPVTIVAEPHLSAWKVAFDIELSAVVYTGIMGMAITLVLTWGLRKKGPVYVAMFKPLSIAIAAILGAIFLRDNVYLGCVIGSSIISIGFYMVMWGKIKEENSDNVPAGDLCAGQTSSCDGKVPLLDHYIVSVGENEVPVQLR